MPLFNVAISAKEYINFPDKCTALSCYGYMDEFREQYLTLGILKASKNKSLKKASLLFFLSCVSYIC